LQSFCVPLSVHDVQLLQRRKKIAEAPPDARQDSAGTATAQEPWAIQHDPGADGDAIHYAAF
jgi:hypothetical protein